MAAVGDIVHGNLSTIALSIALGGLLYANYLLWIDYVYVTIWAFLLAQALHSIRSSVVHRIVELRDSEQTLLLGVVGGARGLLSSPKALLDGLLTFSFGTFTALLVCSLFFSSWESASLLLGGVATLIATALVLLRLFDRALLRWWLALGVSDELFVTLLITLGVFTAGAFVLVLLGTQSGFEGTQAVREFMEWVQTKMNDDATQAQIMGLLDQGKSMIDEQYNAASQAYNGTEWWPAVVAFKSSVEARDPFRVTALTTQRNLETAFGDEQWWPLLDSALDWVVNEQAASDKLVADAWDFAAPYLEFDAASLSRLSAQLLVALKNPVAIVVQAASHLTGIVLVVTTLGITSLLFCSMLFKMLLLKEDMLHTLVCVLVPSGREAQRRLARAFRLNLEAVFLIPLQLSSLHGTVTLLSFTLLRLPFPYFATLLCCLVSSVQVLGGATWLFVLPWTISALASAGRAGGIFLALKAVAALLVHIMAFDLIDTRIFLENKRLGRISDPIFFALSLAVGIKAFGLAGVLLGPLFFSLLQTVFAEVKRSAVVERRVHCSIDVCRQDKPTGAVVRLPVYEADSVSDLAAAAAAALGVTAPAGPGPSADLLTVKGGVRITSIDVLEHNDALMLRLGPADPEAAAPGGLSATSL